MVCTAKWKIMGVLRFDICMRKARGRRYHNGCPS
nr:MAG TPA: hypothetical protein [Caudoviricetes sp.]